MQNKDKQQLELFAQTQGFDLDIKPKKRLWWKELMLFASITGGTFLISYGAMNFSALSQIAEFKWDKAKVSVVSATTNIQETFKPKKLTVQEKTVNIKKHTNIQPKNQAPELFKNFEVMPSDNRIYLPSIDKNIPLVDVPNHKDWKQLEDTIQKGLQNGVVVHPISHDPGNFGNFFITGHSSYYAWDKGRYKDVFALLHEVHPDEEVHVFWEGKKYVYKLSEKKVIDPTEVSVLNQPSDEKIITLMTCTPIGTNKQRLILQGELIES